MNLIFATANPHKIEEVQNILGQCISLFSPADFGYTQEVPETGNSLEENALQKARTIWNALHQNCFADDTGLEVFALGGAPGVLSARYAGPHANMNANIEKLLRELAPHANRTAQFRCVMALIIDGDEFLFEGSIAGIILPEPQGVRGFGYDPLFLPHGYTHTFASMLPEEKNAISHRALALQKMQQFLHTR
ncbi:MAG: RdgB/HAM1 family non-canonical purine NTP pyrophosphatase [Prevotellaceae bacterium]|jgi:XTP/dITP diphosphohydrolase|nr:RdgB/HAM1 family non-canonical purine NTP pyrophosphatase [Prevotellaceae bacterium]